jgi:hypothetical protein
MVGEKRLKQSFKDGCKGGYIFRLITMVAGEGERILT